MGLNATLTTMMEGDFDAVRPDWPTELKMPDGTIIDATASVSRRVNDADGRGFFDQADLIVVGKASDMNAAGGIGVRNFVEVRESTDGEWKRYTVVSIEAEALITLMLQLVKSRAQERTA